MSTSSSTIRMTWAIVYRAHRIVEFNRPEDQTYPGATAFAVFQHQLTAMVFHDFLDDGKAQSGALGPRGDIGLGQAVAHLLRQTATIILDRDGPASLALEQLHRYLPL